jgi:hypothetical protein
MSSVPSFRKKGKVSVWVTVRKPDMKGMDILKDRCGVERRDASESGCGGCPCRFGAGA